MAASVTSRRTSKPSSGRTAAQRSDEGLSPAATLRLLSALEELRDGNFRKKLPDSGDGIDADIARAFNEVAERNTTLATELRRVRRSVGRDGRLSERLDATGAEGSWASCYADANALVDDLVRPVTDVARVSEAVAAGDLTH